MIGIEPLLDALHQRQRRRRRTPDVEPLADRRSSRGERQPALASAKEPPRALDRRDYRIWRSRHTSDEPESERRVPDKPRARQRREERRQDVLRDLFDRARERGQLRAKRPARADRVVSLPERFGSRVVVSLTVSARRQERVRTFALVSNSRAKSLEAHAEIEPRGTSRDRDDR